MYIQTIGLHAPFVLIKHTKFRTNRMLHISNPSTQFFYNLQSKVSSLRKAPAIKSIGYQKKKLEI